MKVLIICNKGSKTGGPKAVHQLFSSLREEEVEVFLCDPYPFENLRQPVEDYKTHQPNWLSWKKIPQDIDLLLTLESFDRLPRLFFKRSTKIGIWWLSVDNAEFDFVKPALEKVRYGSPHAEWHQANTRVASLKRSLRKFLARAFRKVFWKKVNANTSIHFFQSAYAKAVVEKSLGISGYILSDISENYGIQIKQNHIDRSSRLIVYNGNKGAGYVEQLANRLPEFEFVKLQGLDSMGLARAFSKAAFYMDLGHFPGKDRMPREAIRLGCPVVLARRGSARYVDDFDIPEEFRLDIHANSPQQLEDSLRVLLKQSDLAIRRQEDFLEKVLLEDEVFGSEVKTFVKTIQAVRQ